MVFSDRPEVYGPTAVAAMCVHADWFFCSAVGIELATKDNVDWLLHIDTDELMYPGGNAGFSLQKVLSTYADEVDTVVFPNYESLPETDKIRDPFTEVFISSSLTSAMSSTHC